jgi:hypothetical protein
MTKGLSMESFAGKIGVSVSTLHNWRKAHPEFLEAVQKGRAASQLFWEQRGVDGLWNVPFGPSLNAAVWTFNMKNRFGWRDKVEHSGGIDSEDSSARVQGLLKNPDTREAALKVAEALGMELPVEDGDDDVGCD